LSVSRCRALIAWATFSIRRCWRAPDSPALAPSSWRSIVTTRRSSPR